MRVPTFVGHAEAVNLELERPLDDYEASASSRRPPAFWWSTSAAGRLRDAEEVTGQDGVFVSRIRSDPTVENGLAMWVVSDNLRKGAALNAVQIAEELIKGHLAALLPRTRLRMAWTSRSTPFSFEGGCL